MIQRTEYYNAIKSYRDLWQLLFVNQDTECGIDVTIAILWLSNTFTVTHTHTRIITALKLNALETRRTVCDAPFLFEINQYSFTLSTIAWENYFLHFYEIVLDSFSLSIHFVMLRTISLFLWPCKLPMQRSEFQVQLTLDFFAGSITISFGNAAAKFCSILQATYFLFLANNGMLFAKISAR